MPIAPSDNLSRFILQSNFIRQSDETVKPAAFLPNPRNGETSVFLTTDLSEENIWEIGDREIADKRGKAVRGRADIRAQTAFETDLHVNLSEPPPRHANIIGWPDEKSKQLEIALVLAANANLHKRT